ncbi:MAG TPA: helix-turn-helix transcriptional regulator [Bacilli bacterium]|jgi:putative transcriptional regulator|nr:helix-turn-helix transcriptional regulator [Bacilli bacterium]HPZ23331.1 helix-turn-helix transcriptional regulator [Bacilli bacterium]HQC83905.1 helix-turn-helix transcriptional regulator [Bacilli bacterium]
MKNNLESLRKSACLSQEELANKCDVSRQTIISLEQGKYKPSIVLAFKLANIFDKKIEDIFIYEEDKNEIK